MEGFKPNLDKQKSSERVNPVTLTLKAAIAAGVIASASPAEAGDTHRLHQENTTHTITLDAAALTKMASGLIKIAQDPHSKEIVTKAASDMAPIAIDAAKEVAKPALDQLIEGLTEFRNANYPQENTKK